ncbi:hypothetical protein I4U23_027972 [Adineta vaga]|nr:hypothetical protein I4U23_027972 [Adineta vaga]
MNDKTDSFTKFLKTLEKQRNGDHELYIPLPSNEHFFLRDRRDLYIPEEPTLYSATRIAELRDIAGLHIIDMPGFNDTQSTHTQLSNPSILNMIKKPN